MAKIKTNPILEQIVGKVGDLVFKRYGDRIILTRTPDLDGQEPSEAQQRVRENFRQGALYGKTVLEDPQTRAA